jgi:hypothetical protein
MGACRRLHRNRHGPRRDDKGRGWGTRTANGIVRTGAGGARHDRLDGQEFGDGGDAGVERSGGAGDVGLNRGASSGPLDDAGKGISGLASRGMRWGKTYTLVTVSGA